MKKTLLAGLATGLFLTGVSTNAQAGMIIDTGSAVTGYASSLTSSLDAAGNTTTAQWLAAEFVLDQDYYLTDIHGLLTNNAQTGRNFTITIYGDGGDVPDSSQLIYSNTATITGANGQASWEGYHISYENGLALHQGTYWVSFEVRPNNYLNNQYSGSMPQVSATPLGNEAYARGTWSALDTLDIGVRIQGNPAPVPEPATLFLLGTGLAGLAGLRRRKKA